MHSMNVHHEVNCQSKLRRFLQDNGTLEVYRRNEVIFGGKHLKCPGLHYIQYGHVKVVPEEDAEDFIYLIYGKGDIFSVLTMAHIADASLLYVAMDRVKVYCVPVDRLRQALSSDIDLSNGMIRQLVGTAVVYGGVIENLHFKKAQERLIYGLLMLAVRFGKDDGDKVIFDKVFTQKVIGMRTNLSRETVSREFEKLRAKHLITTDNSQVVICDLEGLHDAIGRPFGSEIWSLIRRTQTTKA